MPFYMKALSYKEKVYYIILSSACYYYQQLIMTMHSPLNCMLAVTSYACSYTCMYKPVTKQLVVHGNMNAG